MRGQLAGLVNKARHKDGDDKEGKEALQPRGGASGTQSSSGGAQSWSC